MPVFSVQSYPYRGRSLENHNRMLLTYAGADGLKTGYTAASGFNLVMSAMRDNRRLIGVVMGGDSACQRDRMMADLMDHGFAYRPVACGSRRGPRLREPPSARYTAANFDPSLVIPERRRDWPWPRPRCLSRLPRRSLHPAPPPDQRVAGPAVPAPAAAASGGPSIGSWVIQVGSFSDSRPPSWPWNAPSAALPDSMRSATARRASTRCRWPTRRFHRARLTNLSQDEAVDGCKQLSKRKIYCSAIQVTAWTTPAAR